MPLSADRVNSIVCVKMAEELSEFRTHTLRRLHNHIKLEASDSNRVNTIAAHFDLTSEDSRAVNKLDADELIVVLSKAPKVTGQLFEFDHAIRAATPAKYLPRHRMWFDFTPAALISLGTELMKSEKDMLDKVATTKPPTAESTIRTFAADEACRTYFENMLDFPQHVSADKDVRKASVDAAKKLSAFQVEQSMRTDVYRAFEGFSATDEAAALEGEEKRLLDRCLRSFRRSGLQLEDSKRAELKQIKVRASEISIAYSDNLNEENSKFRFKKEQLAGVSDSQLERFVKEKNDDGTEEYVLSLQYPNYFPVMSHCSVAETRKKLNTEYLRRCLKENTEILEELVKLRHREANLLGFENHAQFMLDIQMAKKPETVLKFIEDMREKIKPQAEKEMKELLEMKKEHCEKVGEEFDGKINSWDFRYYLERRKEKLFEIDDEKVRQYFPVDVVIKGMLGVYEDMLSLKFVEVKPRTSWHEEMRLYEVRNQKDDSEVVGWFFFDLHPREGKYGHAACWPLQPVSMVYNQRPVSACVANFTKGSPGKQGTLTMNEVETLFHEFGHCTHSICSKTKLSRFSGTSVEWDFVEAPSQMLESFVFRPEVLARMSKHIDSGEAMPGEMSEKISKAKNANVGLLTMRQLCLALYDQRLHTRSEADSAKLYADTVKEILNMEAIPDTNMGASFGHLAGGYSARYYGYMYSEVFADDMFKTVFEACGDNVINAEAGARYRKEILEVGGSRDGMDSLKALLGREPNMDAFLAAKGIKESAVTA